MVVEGVDCFPSYDLSGLEEENMIYLSDCVLSVPVFAAYGEYLQEGV